MSNQNMPKDLSGAQYRCLVAYINYWHELFGAEVFDRGMADFGISADREEVLYHLFKCGHTYNEDTGSMPFCDDDPTDAVPAYLPSELTITSPPLTLETQAALTLALASTTDAITREWILATLQRGISA